MHELSLCRSIVHIVDRARGDRPVVAVHVRLGQLRQVVPETLVYCWGLVTQASDLAGSELDVEHVPVVLDCRACGSRTEVAEVLMLTCGTCGAGQVSLVSGEEFLVTSLDLGPAPPPLVPPSPDGRV
jgi:hydrogenase nickel incorporation protein HypA/HybF